MAVERRFHSPYRYWVQGFLFEIAVFVGMMAAMIGIALLAAWIRG